MKSGDSNFFWDKVPTRNFRASATGIGMAQKHIWEDVDKNFVTTFYAINGYPSA